MKIRRAGASRFHGVCVLVAALAIAGVHSAARAEAAAPDLGPVVVAGVVPDEATRQAVVAQLRQLYGPTRVVDHLGVGALSAPPNWSQMVQKMITPELKSIRKGQLSVTGTTVALAGEVTSQAQKQKLESQMRGVLNPTYDIKNGLLVLESGQLQIDETLKDRIVEFEVGSDTLTASGRKVIDELVPVLARFAGSRFSVVGHTDSTGVRAVNLELSRARAKTVKDYLVAQSIAETSIDASGMGPDQPLFANDTAANRAKNRRIEFKLLP